ncbi:MAG TPA: hypothetical protein VH040_18105 [Usitatibacter sp.]|nr:hypothetical protein [Usitatibacter sp.]
MTRLARWLAAAIATLAAFSATAQVLTGPLSAFPRVRLTDSCGDGKDAGVYIPASNTLVSQIADVVDARTDSATLRSLWWPTGETKGFFGDFVALRYDPFQDSRQIAQDISSVWASRGGGDVELNEFICFDPSPPPGIVTVREFQYAHFGEFRLAVGDTEAASLAADGWTPTGETYRVLHDFCSGGSAVYRFIRSQAAWRSGNLLTMNAAECGSIREFNPDWRPFDLAFFAMAPVNGECTGPYSGIAVYRVAFPRAPMGASLYRFTSSEAIYDGLLDQGWTGRGIAFCAMP